MFFVVVVFLPMLAQNIDRGYPLEMWRIHRAPTVHAPYNKTRRKKMSDWSVPSPSAMLDIK